MTDRDEVEPARRLGGDMDFILPNNAANETRIEPQNSQAAAKQKTRNIHDLDHEHAEEEGAEEKWFPRLSNETKDESRAAGQDQSGEYEEQAVPKGFTRSASPACGQRNKNAEYHKVGEEGVCNMHKFSLYETASRFYLVGGDITDRRFRILKIDRTLGTQDDLSVAEDDIIYSKLEMNQLLNAVDDGNKNSGGLKLKCTTWGLLGFIRFTGAYYMLVITKRSQVAIIGGHYIYQVDATELISLTPNNFRPKNLDVEEARFVGILHNLDLSRSFYFSYSYDVTRSLQKNIMRERETLFGGAPSSANSLRDTMFVWNHHLLEPAFTALKNPYEWCCAIIHGFVDQATLSVYGRTVYITLIARRSRYFAGARYLKRGANDLGYVANDVETEQIVSDMLTTSFHAPGPELFANPGYTSYVQHRGSIPLHWTQDNDGLSPKPGINLNLVDPFFVAAALHFDNLFERYGAPIYALNLVKARERLPRESILLEEYTNAIHYLNQHLPPDKKIKYRAWDMSRASKSRDQDVIGMLGSIAEEVMAATGFFHNGEKRLGQLKMQNGVTRTNCIDCLDRTNAAQFIIGKRALGYQLHALGIIGQTSLAWDTDAVNLFTHMFHDHGDTVAMQYGGSHLVNTMETYRKINQWTSHSRDMVESFKRYYNNSFMDNKRQEAYNLFLGNYIYDAGIPMLWDLSTDYYLHHADPRTWSRKRRIDYKEWFTPEFLQERTMPDPLPPQRPPLAKPVSFYDDYWLEYYRPLALSSFNKIFSYKMNSTLRYIPFKSTKEGKYDLSPFRVRDGHESVVPPDKTSTTPKKAVAVTDPEKGDTLGELPRSKSLDEIRSKRAGLPGWIHHHHANARPTTPQGILREHQKAQVEQSQLEAESQAQKEKEPNKDKSATPQWTLDEFVANSLDPSVTEKEARDYEWYVSHPLNMSLVVSSAVPPNASLEFLDYVNSITIAAASGHDSPKDDLADYKEFLSVAEDPLTVTEADASKKRYKAYRQWMKGKSLFKQRVEG